MGSICWYWLAIEMHSSLALSFACSVALRITQEKGPTQKCVVWAVKAYPSGQIVAYMPIRLKSMAHRKTRGIRLWSATRSVSPLLWIRGVQPYPHRKCICVAVDKASVFAMHQRRKLDCCVSALGSYFLLSHFVPVIMPAPRG